MGKKGKSGLVDETVSGFSFWRLNLIWSGKIGEARVEGDGGAKEIWKCPWNCEILRDMPLLIGVRLKWVVRDQSVTHFVEEDKEVSGVFIDFEL